MANVDRAKILSLVTQIVEDPIPETHDTYDSLIIQEVVPIFLDIIKDNSQDYFVREFLIKELGYLQGSGIVETLIELLSDENTDINVKKDAIYALKIIGDSRAIKPLLKCLDNEELVLSVVSLFVDFDDNEVKTRLFDLLERYPEYDELRFAIVETLAELGDIRVLPDLIIFLLNKWDTDERVRYVSASLLGLLGDKRAIKILIGNLLDENPSVVGNSALALAELKATDAVGVMIYKLENAKLPETDALITALSKFEDSSLVDPIINVLKRCIEESKTNLETRTLKYPRQYNNIIETAALALGNLGHKKAIPVLNDALEVAGEDSRTVRTIQQVLLQLGITKYLSELADILENTFYDYVTIPSLIKSGIISQEQILETAYQLVQKNKVHIARIGLNLIGEYGGEKESTYLENFLQNKNKMADVSLRTVARSSIAQIRNRLK